LIYQGFRFIQQTLIIFLISAVLAIRYQINATWLVLGGGLIGWGVSLLGYY
jgi:chromate transporter